MMDSLPAHDGLPCLFNDLNAVKKPAADRMDKYFVWTGPSAVGMSWLFSMNLTIADASTM